MSPSVRLSQTACSFATAEVAGQLRAHAASVSLGVTPMAGVLMAGMGERVQLPNVARKSTFWLRVVECSGSQATDRNAYGLGRSPCGPNSSYVVVPMMSKES